MKTKSIIYFSVLISVLTFFTSACQQGFKLPVSLGTSSSAHSFSPVDDDSQIKNFSAANALIGNVAPTAYGNQILRFDVDGHAVDAHDGEIRFFEAQDPRYPSRYYFYGTSYDCGFTWNDHTTDFCGYKSYTSTDMIHWVDKGLLFDPAILGLTPYIDAFRPKVIFNRATQKYILWMNVVLPNDVGYRVLSSDSPTGPFVLVNTPANLTRKQINGDYGLFVDDDEKAYIFYTNYNCNGPTKDPECFILKIEQLNSDYTDSTGVGTHLANNAVGEAPTMFKRNGKYYALYSWGCPYCPASPIDYQMADSPLGPWQITGDPNTYPNGVQLTSDSCGGQNAHVENISGSYLYISDLWHQPPNWVSGASNIFNNQAGAGTYFGTLSFDDSSSTFPGSVEPLTCSASIPNTFVISKGSQNTVFDLDQSSGDSDFSSACDIGSKGGSVRRMQTFTAGSSGFLSSVSLNTFRSGLDGSGLPDADLNVDIVQAAGGTAGQVLGTYTVSRTQIGYSARKITIPTQISVQSGTQYGIVLRSAISNLVGCYGFAYNDENIYGGGQEYVSTDSGHSFDLEKGRVLKFETTVSASSPTASFSALSLGKTQSLVGISQLSANGQNSLGLQITLNGTQSKTVTEIQVNSTQTGGVWNTIPNSGSWSILAILNSSGKRLNDDEHAVNFTVEPGESFSIYISDGGIDQFLPPGTPLAVTLFLSDGSTLTADTSASDAPTVQLVSSYVNRSVDELGILSFGKDGFPDVGVSLSLLSGVSKTVTGLQVVSATGGVWNTTPGSGNWFILAQNSAGQTLNASDRSLNFQLSPNQNIMIYFSDVPGVSPVFLPPGNSVNITMSFNDGTTSSSTAVLGN